MWTIGALPHHRCRARPRIDPNYEHFLSAVNMSRSPYQALEIRHIVQDIISNHQVRKSIHAARLRPSLVPGAVLIILAGRFRGKKVILLKTLPQGVLLVTGPFKVNGVPLRRVNHRYVIATRTRVEIKGIDEKVVEKVGEEGYFTRDKTTKGKGEEEFFAKGDKPQVSPVLLWKHRDLKCVVLI